MQAKLMNALTQYHDLSESGSMILETVLSETSQAQAFLRPLGSFEELLWQMDKRSPLHATLAAHVDGSTTIEGWRSALDQTRQRHPLWSAVIAQTEDGAPFFQTMHDPGVALRVIEDEFAQAWEREVARELSLRIDAENGPLIRAVLMHTDASSMLILSAHHSICDGMSLAFAMRDVLQALSGSKLKKLSLHSSQEHMIGMCSEPRAQRWSGLRPEVSAARTVYRSNSSIIPEVRSLQFSYALTDALRKRARQEKTTVHAALVAATGIVARRNPGYGASRELHLCSTISNRGRVGSPEDCGVFFTACDFPLPDSPVDDLWNLARRSKHSLSLSVDTPRVCSPSKPMSTPGPQSCRSERAPYDVGIATAPRFDRWISNENSLPPSSDRMIDNGQRLSRHLSEWLVTWKPWARLLDECQIAISLIEIDDYFP
jgi:Condensation domain